MKSEPRAFASLSSGLLARKGVPQCWQSHVMVIESDLHLDRVREADAAWYEGMAACRAFEAECRRRGVREEVWRNFATLSLRPWRNDIDEALARERKVPR